MTLKEFVSDLFGYRIKTTSEGWDEAARNLSVTGHWSITSNPRQFQSIILELIKRVEKLEHENNKVIQPTRK